MCVFLLFHYEVVLIVMMCAHRARKCIKWSATNVFTNRSTVYSVYPNQPILLHVFCCPSWKKILSLFMSHFKLGVSYQADVLIFASLKQWYYRLLMWTNSNYKALYLIKKYFLETSWLSLFLSHALYILISFSFIPILCNTLSNSLWCSWGHSSYLAFCWGTEKWQGAWVFQLTWLCSEWSQIQITVSRAN